MNGEAERNDKHLTTQKALQELSKQHKNPNWKMNANSFSLATILFINTLYL